MSGREPLSQSTFAPEALVDPPLSGLAEVVTVEVGPAGETHRHLAEIHEAPFDLVFIDADTEGYPAYLELDLSLSRTGTVPRLSAAVLQTVGSKGYDGLSIAMVTG